MAKPTHVRCSGCCEYHCGKAKQQPTVFQQAQAETEKKMSIAIKANMTQQQPTDTQMLSRVLNRIDNIDREYTPNGDLARELDWLRAEIVAAMESKEVL